jgi:hypothetical protein
VISRKGTLVAAHVRAKKCRKDKNRTEVFRLCRFAAEEKAMDVIWDMETGDPDDVVSLLLILGHRELKLRAVTICPGGQDQVGFVQYLLKRVLGDREAAKIPIGMCCCAVFLFFSCFF